MLSVEGLTVRAGSVELVRDVSFRIGPGERVGLIGESGSGKSLTALSLMGLLPEGVSAAGTARLREHDLVGVPERRLKSLRGHDLSMVFQEPMTALNPLMRVGAQVAEAMTLHGEPRERARARAVELLGRVRLPDPAQLAQRRVRHPAPGHRRVTHRSHDRPFVHSPAAVHSSPGAGQRRPEPGRHRAGHDEAEPGGRRVRRAVRRPAPYATGRTDAIRPWSPRAGSPPRNTPKP